MITDGATVSHTAAFRTNPNNDSAIRCGFPDDEPRRKAASAESKRSRLEFPLRAADLCLDCLRMKSR